MREREPNQVPAPEFIWRQKTEEAEQITDGLGKGIEEGIKEAVVACQVHGLHTAASCEGHLGEHGLPYPWIDIAAPAPEGWKESREKQDAWKRENAQQQQKMEAILRDFYTQRQTAPDAQLILEDRGIYGAFRLRSRGTGTPEANQETLEVYRQEMDAFRAFLKRKFERL